MRTIQFASGLLMICLLAAGCARENETIKPNPFPVGGPGGKATLRVIPRHHLKNIADATVYIEYDALKAPANGVWDDTAAVELEGGEVAATFDSLKWGNYYIYADGFDSDPEVNYRVTGGGPFTIIDSNKLDFKIFIDVTEPNGVNHK